MNICIQCKHCQINAENPEFSLCAHPLLISPVTGAPKLHCSTERGSTEYASEAVYPCGKQGRLFEPIAGTTA